MDSSSKRPCKAPTLNVGSCISVGWAISDASGEHDHVSEQRRGPAKTHADGVNIGEGGVDLAKEVEGI